ncbi:MAG: hypothetical protein ACXWVM_22290, partial [Polyangiales bacterium]
MPSEKRREFARFVVGHLSADERRDFIGELIVEDEPISEKANTTGAETSAAPTQNDSGSSTNGSGERLTYVARTEAFLADRPDGATTKEVSTETGQTMGATDGTLRTLVAKGLVERRGNRWYIVARPKPPPTKRTIGSTVIEVLKSVS